MYQLDINKGDIILRGKYRNKKEVVKTFGHDEKGQPTINGKRILNFNIEKLLPKKEVQETMKKSELKELIKECYQELNEGKNQKKLMKLYNVLDDELYQYFGDDPTSAESKRVQKALNVIEAAIKQIED